MTGPHVPGDLDDSWEDVAQRWQTIALTWRADLVEAQRQLEMAWDILTLPQQAELSRRILDRSRGTPRFDQRKHDPYQK